MQIYGTLENAQIEILSSDPSAAAQTGRIWWNTTTGQIKSSDGTNLRALLRNDQKAIVGNDGTASNNVRLNRGAPGLIQFVTGADTTAEGSLSTALAKLSFKTESYAFASLPAAGNLGRLAYTTDTLELYVDSGASFINVLSSSTGILPIAKGGTNGSTATTGFNNLSPMTTKGDLIVHNGTNNVRLPVGTDSQVLTADSGAANGVSWGAQFAAKFDTDAVNNCRIRSSVAASALTYTVRTAAAIPSNPTVSDPVTISFNTFQVPLTTSLSLVVPSGATLGHASGQDHYIYVYALWDNVTATFFLGVSSTAYDEAATYSRTTLSSGSDSNSPLYSDAPIGSYAIKLLARSLSNQATAGTWASNPATFQIPFEKQLIYAEFNTITGQTIFRNQNNILNFNIKAQDTLNAVVTGASWAFTAPKAGTYRISSTVRFNPITTSADQFIVYVLQKNGTNNKTLGEKQHVGSGGAGVFSISGSAELVLASGDTVRTVLTTADSGTAMPTLSLNGSATDNWITISYLGFI